jgi:hypothetical protein
MAKEWTPRVDVNDPKNAAIVKLMHEVRRAVRDKHGTELNYEQRRDVAMEVVASALWLDSQVDLEALVTNDDEVDIGGTRYRRVNQPSSAVYQGRWGSHEIVEPLYRAVSVHNGPTIKPLEARVGMIARRMTPDLARIVGELGADMNSRELEHTMKAVGMKPPSRSFLEKRGTQMATEIAQRGEELEEAVRIVESLPDEIASVSCGLDRMAVRMSEPHGDPDNAPAPRRDKPYQRTPPPPKEHNYRMAWVGTTTAYNKDGEPLHTWRYGAEASADRSTLARRVCADVVRIMKAQPNLPVICVQDGAPELGILPRALHDALPANTNIRELIDFEHLMGYLDEVVDKCEQERDPSNMKAWYRHELLRDDATIERISRNLKLLESRLTKDDSDKREAVAAALSYIGKRKDKMRYASLHAAKLAIGSGATEGTCGLMQQRVKRRGQSWQPKGLRAIMTLRSLVLSARWDSAWQIYAAAHRAEVRHAA